ncbi:hypothetical protein RGQ29_005855 [Quercus rubra]|uniref:xyloglucan:xyloglucosyl transferase n=1 Tax=Quercus rubra TaxID=3512 RepID=A0AAN7E5C4_QUERU|nr:hypothetical protein RGQ29_005855 [Quercus rubra]
MQLKSGDGNNRDEVDFEFLGNVIGKPYGLQTNIFSDGSGNREQRIHLWFDPTKDFHTYSILWNIYLIMFMVDGMPIRVYRNHADKGVQYPQWKPMNLVASIWNGEGWATRGGKDKIDWSKAPFIASFRNYKVDACFWRGSAGFCRANSPSNWWNNPRFSQLNPRQRKMLVWVRKYYMYYDYCTDRKRFPSLPKECTIAL